MSALNRLRDYFQSIADSLSSDKAASKVFPNASDAGTTRENILLDFLSRHIPKRCEVIKGGFLFNSRGEESKQVDIIITNDIAIQFKQFEKSFSCVEGCYCVLCVKTNLDKKALFDALDNVASIPYMTNPEEVILLMRPEILLDMPYKVVFAYEGISFEAVCQYADEFYSMRPTLENRQPDLIVVNNKYVLLKHKSTEKKSENAPPLTTSNVMVCRPENMPYVGAFGLMYLLNLIQDAAGLGNYLRSTFHHYIDKTPFAD